MLFLLVYTKKKKALSAYKVISPSLISSTTAPALPFTDNFCIVLEIWFLTVFSLIDKTSAISLVLLFSTNKLNVFNIEQINIRKYFRKQFVDLIFCLDSRVIFMKDLTLIKKFLFDSKMILKENGYVVIEVVNFAKLNFEEDSIQMPTRESCRGSLFTTIIKDKKTATYRLFQNIVTTNDTVIEKVKNEEVWPISIDTFTSISNELGFSSVNFFSDFNGASYSEDTDNLICVFKK